MMKGTLFILTSFWQLTLVTMYMPTSPSVWKVFGDLSNQYDACNLGQGFPDWETPSFVLNTLNHATHHQYTSSSGFPRLSCVLASKYSSHINREISATTNVAITVGASQALYLSLISLLKNGDEVILFDPYFELYAKQISLTPAKVVHVALGGAQATPANPWALDIELLRRSITAKTKVLLLNSPHNPTGKVFSLEELKAIAEVVRDHPNIIVISDEVYKYTIFDDSCGSGDGEGSPVGHHHFARLPGMWDRTLTISSAGKTFSVTGWQVGWMVGPEKFIGPVQALLPCVQFCVPTPLQDALSYALEEANLPYEGYNSYYEWLRRQFAHKRSILATGLESVGITPLPSQGGFFLMGRLPGLPASTPSSQQLLQQGSEGELTEPYDWQYCRRLAENGRVIGIPAGPFFSRPDYYLHNTAATGTNTAGIPSAAARGGSHHQGDHRGPLARFAFCKKDETLYEAVRRLRAFGSTENNSLG